MGLKEDMNKRIAWVDCAKGIAMFLTILGHTLSSDGGMTDQIVRGAIYSFHMPLFFILSAYTFKLSTSNDEFVHKTENAFKHLIIPAMAIFLLRSILEFQNGDIRQFVIIKFNSFMFASGVDVNLLGAIIPAAGMIWFLIVLFFARSMFDYIHLKQGESLYIIAIICSVLGICVSKVQWLPLSLDIALTILPFFCFGYWIKKKIYLLII